MGAPAREVPGPVRQTAKVLLVEDDDMVMEIIRNLWDGRTPYSDIAGRVGLTTNTVRNRVNRK